MGAPSAAGRRAGGWGWYGPHVAALWVATLLAYSNCFSSGFVLDNRTLLLNDPRIQTASAENVALIAQHTYWWPNGESGLYRPLTTLSYLLNYSVLGNGGAPAGYHWVNVVLQAVNAALVLGLMRQLLRGRPHGEATAFFSALVWAVHPLLTESVTNMVGRADLLAGCAVLGGFLLYLRSRETAGWRRAAALGGLAGTAAAGMSSKESAVVLPLVICLYEAACGRRWDRLWAGCGVSAAAIGAVLWQRAAVLSSSLPAEFGFLDNPIAGAGFWTARLTALKILPRYLWLSVWPQRLSADYSYDQIALARGSAADWMGWAAAAAVAAGVAMMWRRERLGFFFAGFAFLNLLPASNLMFAIGAMMAERFFYLPLAGVIAAAALVFEGLAGRWAGGSGRRRRVVTIVVWGVAAGFGVRTWLRNVDWTSDRTMAEAGVRTSPRSFKFHRLLAFELVSAEDGPRDIERAVREADRSVAILDAVPDARDLPGPWNLAAVCHRVRGDGLSGEEARREYEASVRLARRAIAIGAALRAAYERRYGRSSGVPAEAAEPYLTLAAGYLRLGRAEEALEAARRAQGINPEASGAYEAMADAEMELGDGEEAAVALAEGMLATGDRGLMGRLVRLYESGLGREGCAVVEGGGGPRLDPRCGRVHGDLCRAASRLRRGDLSRRLGCAE